MMRRAVRVRSEGVGRVPSEACYALLEGALLRPHWNSMAREGMLNHDHEHTSSLGVYGWPL